MKINPVYQEATNKVVVKKNNNTGYIWQIDELVALAASEHWTAVGIYQDTACVCFCRKNDRISYYYKTGTIACSVNHPNMGKSQLFRMNPFPDEVLRIFQDTEDFVLYEGKKMTCRRTPDTFGQIEPALGPRRWFASLGIRYDFDRFKMNVDDAAVVALGTTWFVSSALGRYRFGDRTKVSKVLFNKLHGRQPWAPHVDILAMGPDQDTFFIQFADGSNFFQGLPEDLRKALEYKRFDDNIQTLALGPGKSYFCLWSDGVAKWNHLSLKMEKALRGNKMVEEVTMGPKGEYFIRFDDDDWNIGGHCQSCDNAIRKLEKEMGKRIVHVLFGHDDNWIITYE
jgi:hypothetical protein